MHAPVNGLSIFAYFDGNQTCQMYEAVNYGKKTVRLSPQSEIRQSAGLYYSSASKWATK
jgi:hypothetical protein